MAGGVVRRVCGLASLVVVVATASAACSAAPQVTDSTGNSNQVFTGTGFGPVSSTSDPACLLLRPNEIKAAFGSAPPQPHGGQTQGVSGHACWYLQTSNGLMLQLYLFPDMGEQAFREDRFLTSPSVTLETGSQRVPVAGIGDEAVSWNENDLGDSIVAFRKGSNVAVVSVGIFPTSMSNSSRLATAIALAKDAASKVSG